jgi:hypothetical protein
MDEQSRTQKSARPEDFIKLDRSRPYALAKSNLSENVVASEDVGPARQKLAQALDEAWDVYQDSSDGGRRGICMGVAAACEFLMAAAPESGKKFDLFNMVLIAALDDVGRGVVAPLLNKGAKYDRHSFAYRDLQKRAAGTMAGLMDAGHLRDDAAKKVANTLRKNGLDITPRVVEKWYDEELPAEDKQRKGRPPKSTPDIPTDNAHLHYAINNNQARPSRTDKQYVKFVLEELTYFTKLWLPSLSKT